MPFISDTLCYHSGGCGAFERLLSDGKRERGSSRWAEVTAVVVVMGMCVLGGERRAELCPQCSKTSSFCLRGGNWDAKPARASHSSFPFSSLLSFSRSGGGSSDTSRPLPPPWLPPFHSLSLTLPLMISCFLCSSLPRPPTGTRALEEAWPPEGRQPTRAGRR